MRIRWSNVYGLLGIIFGIWLFRHLKPAIITCFESMQNNSDYLREHPAMPYLTIVAALLLILAIIKVLSEKKK